MAKIQQKWTEEEVVILKEGIHNKLSIKEIAEKLNRKSSSVSNKIMYMGLSASNPDKDLKDIENDSNRYKNRLDTYRKVYNNTINGRLSRLVRRSRKLDKNCDISLDFLINLYYKQNGLCKYSGLEMKFEDVEKRDFYLISIDRIDSDKGYTQDNIALCCWGINRIKSELSVNEFIKMCGIVFNYNNLININNNEIHECFACGL